MLGKSKQQFATLYMTYSYIDFQYMEYLVDCFQTQKIKDDWSTVKSLLLQFAKFRLGNGNNILHIMATNQEFLTLYLKQIRVLIEELEYKDGDQFIFLVVIPNNRGETPFDIAIQEHAPRAIEIMLDIMCIKPKYNFFSKYI